MTEQGPAPCDTVSEVNLGLGDSEIIPCTGFDNSLIPSGLTLGVSFSYFFVVYSLFSLRWRYDIIVICITVVWILALLPAMIRSSIEFCAFGFAARKKRSFSVLKNVP